MKLRGKINQCPSCGQYFSTVGNFDTHRTGAFSTGPNNSSPERRCMNAVEMGEAGLTLSDRGVWMGPSRPGYLPKRPTQVVSPK